MAGSGLALLHKLLLERKGVGSLSEFGLKADDFVEEERTVYNFMVQHFKSYGEMPKVRTVEVETKVRLMGFRDEPLEYWVDQVKTRNQRRLILKTTKQIEKLAHGEGLERVKTELKELLFELEPISPNERIHRLSDIAPKVLEAHDTRQRCGRRTGEVPFGIRYLDEVSDGAQAGDTVAVVGRPGVGKTYLLIKMALSAWGKKCTPLFLSMEMSPVQVARRILALKSKLSASRIRLGRLSYLGKNKLIHNIKDLREKSNERSFYLMVGSLTSTVEDLVLRVQETRPSALYVDGAYMLKTRTRTQAKWERVAETAEMLKRIASGFSIPVIASYQFNRRGPGSLGNIAFSDAIGQLASIVVGISEEEGDGDRDPDDYYYPSRLKILQLIKGREGEKGTIRVRYDMERMLIEQDTVLTGHQLGEEEGDAEEEDEEET